MKIDNFGDLGGLVQAKQTAKKPRNTPATKTTNLAVRSTRQQIFLRRKIEVKCWRVVGDVAMAKRRPELLTVLQRANDVIADKQSQLATLDEYKKSLIFEYVTGKKEVPVS